MSQAEGAAIELSAMGCPNLASGLAVSGSPLAPPIEEGPRLPLMTVEATAAYLGTSPRHVQRLYRERRLPHVRVGGKVRFDRAALDEWIEQHRVEAAP